MYSRLCVQGCGLVKMFVASCICAHFFVSGFAQADSALQDEEFFLDEVPVVVSASRMAQPVTDAPVAVTVISRSMIDASGAREIPELFRLVPGFLVGYHDGHTASVSNHMSIDRFARRMQVLVDGRSVYTTATGGIPWATMAVSMDDIERIEVIRGPNSSSYGANSFLGVINIITKHAVTERGTQLKAHVGDQGLADGFVRHGASLGVFDYRLSVAYQKDDGFPGRYDDKRTRSLAFRGDYNPNVNDFVTMHLGVGGGPRQVENPWEPNTSVNRTKHELNHHQHVKWERNLGQGDSLSLQYYHIMHRNAESYSTLPFEIKPNLLVLPIDVDFSRRIDRHDLEFQHTSALGDELRFVWGAGARVDKVNGGDTLFTYDVLKNYMRRGFVGTEWNPSHSWLFNAALMAEDFSSTGISYSPRLGVNYHFNSEQGLRISASRAVRNPSAFEREASYSYQAQTAFTLNGQVVAPGPNLMDVVQLTAADGLIEERISAYEIGTYGVYPSIGFNYDLRVFFEQIRELVVEVEHKGYPDVNGEVDVFDNADAADVAGFEVQSAFGTAEDTQLWLSYAYRSIDDRGDYTRVDNTKLGPRHAASVLLTQPLPQSYRASLGYYYVGQYKGWESHELREPLRRLDLKLEKSMFVLGREVELALAMRNILDSYEEAQLLRPKARFNKAHNIVDDSYYLSVRVLLP